MGWKSEDGKPTVNISKTTCAVFRLFDNYSKSAVQSLSHLIYPCIKTAVNLPIC